MKIPRLGIIEIENIYNRNKPSNKKTDKMAGAVKYFEKIEMGKSVERRIAFQTISEILSIKNDGAENLPLVDLSLLQ